jgi:hypothetical protein
MKTKMKVVVELNNNYNSNSNPKQQTQLINNKSSSSANKERIEKESKRIQEKSLRNRQSKIKSLLLEGVLGPTVVVGGGGGGGGDGSASTNDINIIGVSSRKKNLNESYDRWNKQGTSFIVDKSSSSNSNSNSNSNSSKGLKKNYTTSSTNKTKNKKEKKEQAKTTTTNDHQQSSFVVGENVMVKVKNKITEQIITHGPYVIINYLASIDGHTDEDKVIIRKRSSFTPVYETISVTKIVPYREYYE